MREIIFANFITRFYFLLFILIYFELKNVKS